MNKSIFIPGLVLVVAFGGCTLAPKYTQPASPIPTTWPVGAAYVDSRAAAGTLEAVDLRWQEFFADGKLRQVIGLALTNN